jgi:hypothetical protein
MDSVGVNSMPTKLTGVGEFLGELDGRSAEREWDQRMAATQRLMDLGDAQFEARKANDAAQTAAAEKHLHSK